MSNDPMYRAATTAANLLSEIAEMWKDPKWVTLIIRRPGDGEQDFILTTDTPDELRKVVDRMASKAGGYNEGKVTG